MFVSVASPTLTVSGGELEWVRDPELANLREERMDRSTRDIPAAIDVIRRAEALHQKLVGAKLALRWHLDLVDDAGTLELRGGPTGDPLERLADAVLRSAIESGLDRYRRWLHQLAGGAAAFPEQQFGKPIDPRG
jgi:hypothetical protein